MPKGETGSWQTLFGHELGTSGNLFKAAAGGELSHLAWLRGGAESGVGLLFYQTGALGQSLVVWLLIRGYQQLTQATTQGLWVGLWVVYWASAAVQENLINLNFLALLLVVAIFEQNIKERRA